MAGKKRLDVMLVERGLFSSRERARAAVMAGAVLVAGDKVDKPGTMVPGDVELRMLKEPLPFVSRGGLKLEKAVRFFDIDLAGKTVLDVGASTGGFTDCALKHGASRVYAVDVGYGQLAWELRQDPRVVCLERTNIRYLTPKDLGDRVDVATVDVSFISLAIVLPAVAALINEDAGVITLIKPQFEAGRERVGKRGVVRDPAVHQDVILRVLAVASEAGLVMTGLTYSPLCGPEGNIEYLAAFRYHPEQVPPGDIPATVTQVVTEAHANLPGQQV